MVSEMNSGIDIIIVIKAGAVQQVVSTKEHQHVRIIDLDNQAFIDQSTDYENMPYVATTGKILKENNMLMGNYNRTVVV
jgi:hypothetical protein